MTPYQRGQLDCTQDDCENAHFASIGGLDKRTNPTIPTYIKEADRKDYLKGYIDQAKEFYGDEWQAVKFTWKPVLTITS